MIESSSVCLTEPNQNYPKKIRHNSSPANLECKPHGLMARINKVCKKDKAENICCFLQ